MKQSVFVDTGFWIALLDRRDQYHTVSKELLPRLLGSYRVVLSDFVLFETLTYLNCSVGRHDLAVRFLDKVAAGSNRVQTTFFSFRLLGANNRGLSPIDPSRKS